MPGYAATPADGFSKPSLTCLHCDHLLREPVQTEEGFRLCKQCFKEIQSYPGATCGKCNITASDNCYPDKAVQREVLALQVYCKHSQLGCPWTGTLKQWEAHTGGCSFQGSPCPNQGCVEIISRQALEAHLKECPCRPTLCAHCSTTVAYNLLENHYSVCEEIEVCCEEPLCGQTFLRKNMSEHKTNHCKIETCLTCKTKVFRDSGVEIPEIDQIAAAAICRGGPQAPPTYLHGGSQPLLTNLCADSAHVSNLPRYSSHSSPQPIFSAPGIEDHTHLPGTVHLSNPYENFRHHQDLALSVSELKMGVTSTQDGQKAISEEFTESKKIISQLQSENTELKSEVSELKQAISKIQEQMITAANPVSSIRGNKPSSDHTSPFERFSDQRGAESESPVVQQLRRDLIGLTQTVEDIKSRAERGLARTTHRDDIERDSVRGTRGSGLTSTSDARLLLAVEKRVEEVARQLTQVKLHGQELELQLQASLASTHNGSFLWRIPEVSRRRRDAIDERVTSIYSPPFYTGRNGYKMCIRAYLNGDGMGYKTHLSLFFVLMRGECDPLLKWPFEYKVSMILVDQTHRKHIVQTFKPTPDSSSFQQPQTDMNVASGCPQFAKLSVFDEDCYVKNDVMFVKCIVDITKIFHP